MTIFLNIFFFGKIVNEKFKILARLMEIYINIANNAEVSLRYFFKDNKIKKNCKKCIQKEF